MMDTLETIISLIDYATDTDRKRHVVGGILLSISMLFGGLAFTAMTIKNKEKNNEQ